MKSQRQWQESRSDCFGDTKNRQVLKLHSHKNDDLPERRADSGSSGDASPTDSSKRELEELEQLKQNQTQERVLAVDDKTAAMNLLQQYTQGFEDYTESFRRKFIQEFLSAREIVKKSNRKKGIEPSKEIDALVQYMVSSDGGSGHLLTGPQDAVNKIQQRMLLDYSSNN